MQKYILDKGFSYKLFMLLAFSIFALVMYQGHLKNGGIYSVLFFLALALCAFQIASAVYVTFVKRSVELHIDEKNISWEMVDNKKLVSKKHINRDDIKEVKTEINYLTGNFYSSFAVTFILNNDEEIVLTDGIFYDFGLKKAEDLCRFLLDNEIGHKQDVKFAKIVKEKNIDLRKENFKFTKKDGKSYYYGFLSKNKKEFLSLRLQIEARYTDYKKIVKNANNEYLVENHDKKDSFIYLRSNAIGLFIELYNVPKIEEFKTLKEMGHRKKIGF